MQIRKAVITAAAPGENRLPLQQLVDRHGDEKTALALVVEETIAAGIEETRAQEAQKQAGTACQAGRQKTPVDTPPAAQET